MAHSNQRQIPAIHCNIYLTLGAFSKKQPSSTTKKIASLVDDAFIVESAPRTFIFINNAVNSKDFFSLMILHATIIINIIELEPHFT